MDKPEKNTLPTTSLRMFRGMSRDGQPDEVIEIDIAFKDAPSILVIDHPTDHGRGQKYYHLSVWGDIEMLNERPEYVGQMAFTLKFEHNGKWTGASLNGYWNKTKMDTLLFQADQANLRVSREDLNQGTISTAWDDWANSTAVGGFPIPMQLAGFDVHLNSDYSLSGIAFQDAEMPRICFEFGSEGQYHSLTIQSLQHKHTFFTPLHGHSTVHADGRAGILQDMNIRQRRLDSVHQAEDQVNGLDWNDTKSHSTLEAPADILSQSQEGSPGAMTPSSLNESVDPWQVNEEMLPEDQINPTPPLRAVSPTGSLTSGMETGREPTLALSNSPITRQPCGAIFDIPLSSAAGTFSPKVVGEWRDLFPLGNETFIVGVDDQRYQFNTQAANGDEIVKVDSNSPAPITLHTKSESSGFMLGNGNRQDQ